MNCRQCRGSVKSCRVCPTKSGCCCRHRVRRVGLRDWEIRQSKMNTVRFFQRKIQKRKKSRKLRKQIQLLERPVDTPNGMRFQNTATLVSKVIIHREVFRRHCVPKPRERNTQHTVSRKATDYPIPLLHPVLSTGRTTTVRTNS